MDIDMKFLIKPVLTALCVSLLQWHTFAQLSQPPNIVLIVADDLGYGDVAFNKGSIPTPCLNQLAADGARFNDFHTSGAVCSPTRAGLMTGVYQYRVGVPGVIVARKDHPEHHRALSANAVTFPQTLKKRGYRTALFGKWHLGYDTNSNPLHFGFDEFKGYLSGQVDYHSHIDLAGTFDWWNGLQKSRDSGYTTHLITRQAIGFIKANRQQPFCVVISHQAVHNPYQGPDDRAFRQEGISTDEVPREQQVRKKKATFALMMQELDKSVGQVRQVLKETGLEKNTIIIFISDNGGVPAVSSNAPFRGGKGTVFEGGHRVPAVITWPGRIRAAQVNEALVSSLDLMPTILELTHTPYPASWKPDGMSLAPLLLQQKPLPARTLFWNNEKAKFQYGVRRGPWKLVGTQEGETLLFNLSDNTSEQVNVAAAHQDIVKELEQAYISWKEDVNVAQYFKD